MTIQWYKRNRKGFEYYSGKKRAKGWCIFQRADGFWLNKTNRAYTDPAKPFGPFSSVQAAMACWETMSGL